MTKVNTCCDICNKPMRVTAWRTEDGELMWFSPLCSSKCKSEQQKKEDAADEVRRLIKHRRMFGPRARDRAVKKLWRALTNDKDLPHSQDECIDQIRGTREFRRGLVLELKNAGWSLSGLHNSLAYADYVVYDMLQILDDAK